MFVKIGNYFINSDKVRCFEIKEGRSGSGCYTIIVHWFDGGFNSVAFFENKCEAELSLKKAMDTVNFGNVMMNECSYKR